MGPDFYEVLGVASDADADQITRAFRRLIRTLHPDATGSAAQDQATGERLAQVLAAWRVLHDPIARSAYDSTRTALEPGVRPAAAPGERPAAGSGPGRSGPGPDSTDPPLIVGPTIAHGRSAAPSRPPHIRVGPPIRLDE